MTGHPHIAARRVVSAPGAAIEVVEFDLTREGRRALEISREDRAALGLDDPDRRSWFDLLVAVLGWFA